jgi:hypothetical protein
MGSARIKVGRTDFGADTVGIKERRFTLRTTS